MEVQVRVREAESYVRLDTAGGAEGMKRDHNGPTTYMPRSLVWFEKGH